MNNGRGLTSDIVTASKQYCGAVAVSAYQPYTETISGIDLLSAAGIRVNLHYMLSSDNILAAIEFLKHPPKFMEKINALIFLNYKPIGRSVNPEWLHRDTDVLEEFFEISTSRRHKFKIGFDSCSVSGVMSFSKANFSTIEACDAGRFSMFIAEDLTAYPCSFYINCGHGVSILDRESFLCAWQDSRNFRNVRDFFLSHKCDCDIRSRCLNGCPIFPEIGLCHQMVVLNQ